MKKIFLLFLSFIVFTEIHFCQESIDNNSLFNLGTTPFISKSKLNLNVSYGINYGYPSQIAREWMIPSQSREVIMKNIKAKISFDNDFEIFYSYQLGYSQAFNDCLNKGGVDYKHNFSSFGFHWKISNSENYSPDFLIGLNYYSAPFSIVLGSSRKKLKYYAGTDLSFFYYIPFPYNSYLGISYELFNKINLYSEYRLELRDGSVNIIHNIKTGALFKLFNYFFIDISLFYFNFEFSDAIPFRTGCTWKDPNQIITIAEKNNYFLFSTSININIPIIK